MSRLKTTLLLAFCFLCACESPSGRGESETAAAKTSALAPVIPFAELTTDFKTWWDYHYEQINLSADFVPLDTAGVEIPRVDFVKALSTGEFITIEVRGEAAPLTYQLFHLPRQDDPTIAATIKNVTAYDLQHLLMVGQPFPEFTATDLSGRPVSNESLLGKTTVLKTWFTSCKPCIAEFPQVNQLVARYKDKPEVQFISLALDQAPALKMFLAKHPLSYTTLADQGDLIREQLQLKAFPTHLVVGPDGKILKVINKLARLEAYLEETI